MISRRLAGIPACIDSESFTGVSASSSPTTIIVGTVIIGLSMLINVAPLYMAGGLTGKMWLPLGSLFVVLTVAVSAFGELFASGRRDESVGSLAPQGRGGPVRLAPGWR